MFVFFFYWTGDYGKFHANSRVILLLAAKISLAFILSFKLILRKQSTLLSHENMFSKTVQLFNPLHLKRQYGKAPHFISSFFPFTV